MALLGAAAGSSAIEGVLGLPRGAACTVDLQVAYLAMGRVGPIVSEPDAAMIDDGLRHRRGAGCGHPPGRPGGRGPPGGHGAGRGGVAVTDLDALPERSGRARPSGQWATTSAWSSGRRRHSMAPGDRPGSCPASRSTTICMDEAGGLHAGALLTVDRFGWRLSRRPRRAARWDRHHLDDAPDGPPAPSSARCCARPPSSGRVAPRSWSWSR